MRDYEEFREAIEALVNHHYPDAPRQIWVDGAPMTIGGIREEAYWEVWKRLGLQDYVDRVYMLGRDDVRGTARDELGIDLNTMDLPEDFWHNVQKGIESGLSCSSEVVRTAIEEALDAS